MDDADYKDRVIAMLDAAAGPLGHADIEGFGLRYSDTYQNYVWYEVWEDNKWTYWVRRLNGIVQPDMLYETPQCNGDTDGTD